LSLAKVGVAIANATAVARPNNLPKRFMRRIPPFCFLLCAAAFALRLAARQY
jgi:hypothetical protein